MIVTPSTTRPSACCAEQLTEMAPLNVTVSTGAPPMSMIGCTGIVAASAPFVEQPGLDTRLRRVSVPVHADARAGCTHPPGYAPLDQLIVSVCCTLSAHADGLW